MVRQYHSGRVTRLAKNQVFVFGSNLAGVHGAGAAKQAMKFGARWGVGEGEQGQSYALPTKDEKIKTLPIDEIRYYVKSFKAWAAMNPQSQYLLTAVGCGLAGYKPKDIAPMFADSPMNVVFPPEFR